MRKVGIGLLGMVWVALWIGSRTTEVSAKQEPTKAQAALGVKVTKDVEYGRASGESLRLDLSLPAVVGQKLRPGIVFVHGGGWVGGDKVDFATLAQEMAGRGYVAVSINYRLAPQHPYPANIDDVQRAVRWLRKHATEYHLDPARIGSLGASAGGHLASILGVMDTRDPAAVNAAVSSRVNCVVDYFGRMDLRIEPTGTGFTDYRQRYIGKTKDEAPELYAAASPITYVDSKTVPFLIVQGLRDPQVQPVQSKTMIEALDKAGIESSALFISGAKHGFGGEDAKLAWETARAFLDRHLHP